MIVHGDDGAVAGQPPRNGPADAAARAGHQRGFSGQRDHTDQPCAASRLRARSISVLRSILLVPAPAFVDEFDPRADAGRPDRCCDGELADRLHAGPGAGPVTMKATGTWLRSSSGSGTTAACCDLRMPLQQLLDLARIDVLAGADEHVVGAADEIEEAVLVAPHHVAAVVPAVDERLRGLLRQIMVMAHQRGIAHQQHALVLGAVDQLDSSMPDADSRAPTAASECPSGAVRTPRGRLRWCRSRSTIVTFGSACLILSQQAHRHRRRAQHQRRIEVMSCCLRKSVSFTTRAHIVGTAVAAVTL